MKEICSQNLCTGCGVCSLKCPANCIKITENSEGFLMPKIDEQKCISCDLCKKICPSLNQNTIRSKIQKVYKCRSINSKEIFASTSGGVVYEISKYCIKKNGIFFGAELLEDLTVRHTYAELIEDLKKYQGSKYIQSYTGNTFMYAKKFLKEGRFVVYVGTPCQINALKRYLNKEYSNLLTIDFICHGVGSSKVFRLSLNDMVGDKYNDNIKKISFRNKKHGYINGSLILTLTDGTYKEYPSYENTFGRAFATDLITRESCINCKYVGIDRVSDITVSDYTGNDMDENDQKYGCSFVFINTDKGNSLFKECRNEFKIEEKTLDYAISHSYHLTKYSNYNKNRKKFFQKLNTTSFHMLKKRYIDLGKMNKIKKIIYSWLKRIKT